MKRRLHATFERPWTWCLAIVLSSALIGVWHGRSLRESPKPQTPRKLSATQAEQIEAVLARAGCPGWMVLASEGEAAIPKPADHLTPQNIRQTSTRIVEQVPRVTYPIPLRVAQRPSRDGTSSSDDPNDLLDGMPDLLSKPEKKEPPSAPSLVEELPSVKSNLPKQDDLDTAEPTPHAELRILPPTQAVPRPLTNTRPEPPDTPEPSNTTFPSPAEPIAPSVDAPSPKRGPFAPPPMPNMPPPHAVKPNNLARPASGAPDKKTYCNFLPDSQYPTAEACSKCHQKIYDEWSMSSHAYAMVSPMFHKFEQKINDLSLGTIGYFCYRCHSPAGVSMGISRAAPIWDLPQVAREGVTCVACHRVNERLSRVNGERRIEPGNIHAPVYGSIGGEGVAKAIANSNQYKVKTSPYDQGPGQDIHAAGFYFDQLSKAEFCVSCHQVAVHPGIKLEVVWEQYRASPACKKGISCQDCHMGRIPGVPSGYEVGAAAKINDQVVNSHRKHANHVFYGPGYSIAHPGIFPFNPKASRWSTRAWLLFDHRAGWGTDAFEEQIDAGRLQISFPQVWAEVDDRYDAREIIDDNLKKLQVKKISRMQIMENGSHVEGPFFDSPLVRGNPLRFHYVMINANEGHNLPSGSLGAQPQLWANVVLIGPHGQRLWESGYTDRWGDVADIHSEDVRQKRIPFDSQLFNLQTMFLITGVKGTDREFFLPINVDIDQLPFIRPGAQPISVINHPPFIRMEGRSLAPLGSRRIPYKVPSHLLQKSGRYRLSFRLRNRMEPIYFMRFVGATREMQRAMNEGMLDFHQSSVEFMIR